MIVIKTEKVKYLDSDYRSISSITNLRFAGVFNPDYENGYPYITIPCGEGFIEIWTSEKCRAVLKSNAFYPEDHFQRLLKEIRRAGDRAHKIGLVKNNKKEWEGEETFKI